MVFLFVLLLHREMLRFVPIRINLVNNYPEFFALLVDRVLGQLSVDGHNGLLLRLLLLFLLRMIRLIEGIDHHLLPLSMLCELVSKLYWFPRSVLLLFFFNFVFVVPQDRFKLFVTLFKDEHGKLIASIPGKQDNCDRE